MDENELKSLLADFKDGMAAIYMRTNQMSAALVALWKAVTDYDPKEFHRLYREHYLGPEVSQARHIDDERIQSLLGVAKKLRQLAKD